MSTETVTEVTEIKRVYGWVPDLPSNKDNFLRSAHPTVAAKFPPKMILNNLPPVYDQGQLGSCTANALGTAFQFGQRKQGLLDFIPSRLFIYYNERKLEDNIPYDTGAAISDGIKTLTDDGVCPETLCPYNVNAFTVCPSSTAYKVASDHQVVASRRVQPTINSFKTMINMNLPIVFGFTVYSSFESPTVAKTGIMPLPEESETALGGHAVTCIGYDDTMKSPDNKTVGYFYVRNSWGQGWGQQGNFWMPYDYLEKLRLVSDSWTIMENEIPIKLNREMSQPIVEKTISVYRRVMEFVKKIPNLRIVVKQPELED